MRLLLRAAVLAAAAGGLAPGAGFGQVAAPPAQEPAAGSGEPARPEGASPVPVLPLPPGDLPRIESAPGMRGAHCEHERAPGTGV